MTRVHIPGRIVGCAGDHRDANATVNERLSELETLHARLGVEPLVEEQQPCQRNVIQP